MTRIHLESLCAINPESLDGGTPRDFQFRYVDISSVSTGDINWGQVRRMTFEQSPSRARRRLRPGDVLLCTVRPGLNSHARVSHDSRETLVGSTGFAVLRPNDPLDSSFIFHQLFGNEVAAQLRALEMGSNYPAVNERDVRRIAIYAPAGDERRSIAAVLDTVDEAIAATEAVIGKLKQVRAGLLHDLLTRGLDEHGQLRDPRDHPEQFKDSPLGRIPHKWQVRTLDEAVRVIDCKHYTPRFVADGAPFIRPRNVKPEGLDFSDVDFVSDEDFAILTDKHVPGVGDIVFSRNASFGVACYVADPVRFAIGQDTVVMTCKTADTRFIYFAICSPITESQVARVSTGSTFGRINLAFIRSLLVPCPPVTEQEGIAAHLAQFDERAKMEEGELAKLRALKSGLMTDLLTGRVRVSENVVKGVP